MRIAKAERWFTDVVNSSVSDVSFVQSRHNLSNRVTPFSRKSGMTSPFDLTSFQGFKSFGIKIDDICDNDGAVFAL